MATTQGHAYRKGKNGTRKYGRNEKKCARYFREGRREKNKARRLALRDRKYKRNRQRRDNDGERQSDQG